MDTLDIRDEDGSISLFRLLTRPRYPLGDPRHFSRSTYDRLAQRAIEQMVEAMALISVGEAYDQPF